MADSVRTGEERTAVVAHLKGSGGAWMSTTPDYENYSRSELSKRLEQVQNAVLLNTNSCPLDVADAYEQSQNFIDSAFDIYEGSKSLGEKVARAFVVPMRSNRTDESYASESIPFIPLLEPVRFGVISEVRMRAMYGLPPTVLDTYLSSSNPYETGALVLAPLYADMSPDIRRSLDDLEQAFRLAGLVDRTLERTAEFAHRRLGADFLGLGATLPHPNLTNFGRKLRAIPGMENLTTTTGHGGTVYMLAQTALAAIANTSSELNGRIGLLGGAGSIGWSAIQAVRSAIPDFAILTLDKRQARMRQLVEGESGLTKVTVAESVGEVLSTSKFIISAITETINLEDDQYSSIDFDGTVWLDDSQPGSVDREQLEARGGKVIWVTGQDASTSGFMTRDGYHTNGVGYSYGYSSGLYGKTTEFACGLEAAVVAASQNKENAVQGPVRIEDVEKIGQLFGEYGVEVAPFQSYGRPVHLS